MYLEREQLYLWYDVRISYTFYHQSIELSYLLLLMHLAHDIYIPYKYSTSMLIWFSTVWRYLLEEESFIIRLMPVFLESKPKTVNITVCRSSLDAEYTRSRLVV